MCNTYVREEIKYMVTKKQHYYPRTLLKHFADESDSVYVYICSAKENKFEHMDYKNICSAEKTYELKKEEVNSENINQLEHKFSLLEQKLGPIIDKIIVNNNIKIWNKPSITISEEDIEFLYTYMHIQFIRTDRGRINFINALRDRNYVQRKYPIELEEIKIKKDDIKEFNKELIKEGNFEKLLKVLKKPKHMNFHIFTGDFITSDNPVIGLDNWEQIFMPISPNLCLGFQTNRFSSSNNLIVSFTKEKNEYLNQSQIETANYFIISKNEFDSKIKFYIKSRFRDSNWQNKTKHFKPKEDL